jgi:hypothetical protein
MRNDTQTPAEPKNELTVFTESKLVKINEYLKPLNDKSKLFLNEAESVIIGDETGYKEIYNKAVESKNLMDEAEGKRVAMVKPFNNFVDNVNDAFKTQSTNFKGAINGFKKAMLVYDEIQRKKAAEEQRKKDEEAKKKADELAEKARKEQEKADKAREDAQKAKDEADRLAIAGNIDEAEKLIEDAKKLDKQADRLETKAENLQEKSEIVIETAPVVVAETVKMFGSAKSQTWKYRIKDEKKIPREYLIPNEKLLAGIAKSSKGTVKIEGIEFYSENTMSVRRK